MRRSTVLIALCVLAVVAGPPLGWLAVQREVRLVALDAAGGRVAWSAALDPALGRQQPRASWPTVGVGQVVVHVVSEGRFGDSDDRVRLVAFDAVGGRRWEFAPTPEEFGQFSARDTAWIQPLIAGDTVYVVLAFRGDRNGLPVPEQLVALDAATGRVRWTFAPIALGEYDRHPEVATAGDLVVVPTPAENGVALQALDAASGAPVWRAEPGGGWPGTTSAGPVVVANDRSAFLLTAAGVLAFDVRTGQPRFTIAQEGYGNQLWLDGPTLYVAGPETRSIGAFDAADGTPRWTFQPDGLRGRLRAFRADGGSLYTWCDCRREGERSDETLLIAVDADDGRERWRTPLRSGFDLLPNPPSFTPGLIVVAGDDVAALDRADGSLRWRAPDVRLGAATDGANVFIARTAPRWRHWAAYLDPRRAGPE